MTQRPQRDNFNLSQISIVLLSYELCGGACVSCILSVCVYVNAFVCLSICLSVLCVYCNTISYPTCGASQRNSGEASKGNQKKRYIFMLFGH